MPCTGPGCKTSKTSCCVKCHFEYEEAEALPYLPTRVRNRILAEHEELRANGFPPDAVEEHAEREMPWLRKYCPPEVIARCELDHDILAKGHPGGD